VLAFLPFAGIVSDLPIAILAGIVIGAVGPLVRPLPILRLARLSRPQFLVAAITFVLTLALSPHIEEAVVVGVALAVAVHLWRELRLELPVRTVGTTLHLRPHGVLWFGSAARLEDAFLDHIGAHSDAERLVVHLDGLGRIDITGALVLRALLDDARSAGLEVEITDVSPSARPHLENVIACPDDPLGSPPA
jgi:sulfate permease, SulP family